MKPDELPPAWREYYEERAAIREYDAGFIRSLAESLAMRETVQAMRAAERAAEKQERSA